MIKSIVRAFLTSRMSLILVLFALGVGTASVIITPKEEEPQIVVPMADVIVQVPGASAAEVEKLVTTPLERLMWQIDGVEHVYSISRKDASMVTVRFYVGEDREESLVKLHNTIMKNTDMAPGVVSGWVVKPVEVDDVPIVTIALSSDRYDDHQLRRMAEELFHRLAEVQDISGVSLVGGRPREVRVELSPQRLTAHGLTALEVARALGASDHAVTAGTVQRADTQFTIVSQSFLRSAKDTKDLVVGARDGQPVYLRDVAEVIDGPAEPDTYTRFGRSDFRLLSLGEDPHASRPTVVLALAKKKGTNAVAVAQDILQRLDTLKRDMLPDGVEAVVTRNYGETAHAKVSELISSLVLAVVTVVILLTFTLGWREAAVVALAVPVSFSLALFVNYLLGYSINRVSMFALILSLGLVVDDPITNVDNIQRHILMRKKDPLNATLDGVAEVLPPVIMSTLAIIVCFTPMFFITGMMGPYMAPMAANVPLTVTFSTVCALTIVPWMAYNLLKGRAKTKAKPQDEGGVNPRILGVYERVVRPLLVSATRRRLLFAVIFVLFLASCALPVLRLVPLKMLPFDNKNELQLVIDMPEGTTLETTDRAVRAFERHLRTVPEITNFTTFAGTSSPMDFNGLVRHHYWRKGPNMADIRINLADKSERKMQSHEIALRLRADLEAVAREHGASIQILESPPGPPVMSTLTAETYGKPDLPYDDIIAGARHVADIMAEEPAVTDIDTSAEAEHMMFDFEPNKEKAALHGIDTEEIVGTLRTALSGQVPGTVHLSDERQQLPVRVILPLAARSRQATLEELMVKSDSDQLVPLAELGTFRMVPADQPIYHKDLRRVAYTYGEMAGRAPGEAIIDMMGKLRQDPTPPGTTVEWAGEGEWQITLDVFRDLGIAFGVALLGIYVLMIIETGSYSMPLLIMSAIPLTLLGIMPGFWLLNVIGAGKVGAYDTPIFFTATSMIGMIALGGIVIRNSLVLIDFIRKSMAAGMGLEDAIVQSGAVRLRPIVLTAATTALGAWPITLDPIFSGLAWALIFGLFASTAFTLVVIPAGYYAFFRGKG